jgi:DNA-binding beta-propeller fold protein YncE
MAEESEAETYGSGDFKFNYTDGWAKLPGETTFLECPGVAVDSKDNVFVLTRGEHPVMVFDKNGNFLRSFGEGNFTNRTHGLYIAHDDTLLIADDALHTIQKFSSDGVKLMEIGERKKPKTKWGGEPFNRPTSAAIMPSSGDIYVSDGYGNARIHCFTGQGEYKFSWGSSGIDEGQFMRPHNIAIDSDDRVYVVDREAHRVQVFDAQGKFLAMWSNIHRPDCMVLWDNHIYIGELNGMDGLGDAPDMGHRVGVYDLNGKLQARFGASQEGSGAGEFVAPHGIAVDSHGALFVAEVSFTMGGRHLDPPRELRSLSKWPRV